MRPSHLSPSEPARLHAAMLHTAGLDGVDRLSGAVDDPHRRRSLATPIVAHRDPAMVTRGRPVPGIPRHLRVPDIPCHSVTRQTRSDGRVSCREYREMTSSKIADGGHEATAAVERRIPRAPTLQPRIRGFGVDMETAAPSLPPELLVRVARGDAIRLEVAGLAEAPSAAERDGLGRVHLAKSQAYDGVAPGWWRAGDRVVFEPFLIVRYDKPSSHASAGDSDEAPKRLGTPPRPPSPSGSGMAREGEVA